MYREMLRQKWEEEEEAAMNQPIHYSNVQYDGMTRNATLLYIATVLGNYFYIRLLRKRLGCGLWFINKCFCVWWLLLGKGGGERGDDNCYLKCVDCSWWAKKANCYLKSNWNFDFYFACRNKNPWCGILSVCQRRRIPKGATGGTEGHERQGEELLSVCPAKYLPTLGTHTHMLLLWNFPCCITVNIPVHTVCQVFPCTSIFRYVRESIKVVKNAIA